jgi:phosphoglycerate kinase
MGFRTLDQAILSGKRALVRVDFNVPMAEGAVSDDTRLRSALPTIEALRRGGAKVVLLAHFDRPKGKRVPEMSLRPVAAPLAALLNEPVLFAEDCIGAAAKAAVEALEPRGVVLLENLRFHAGEEANDPEFARALA